MSSQAKANNNKGPLACEGLAGIGIRRPVEYYLGRLCLNNGLPSGIMKKHQALPGGGALSLKAF